MNKYILVVDQSTSASKVILFSRKGDLIDRVTIPHKQYYPGPGFVEHDAEEIFANVLKGIDEVTQNTGISIDELAAISITNQRETALVWDKNTGVPVARAAVWQCQRGEEYCRLLKEKGHEKKIKEKTGLIIDPYFSASKLHWIMKNIDGLSQKAENGGLLWGTMDCWLLWKLTAGRVHATDHSNACRTMLYNVRRLEWDSELLEVFSVHPSMFPEVKFSDTVFGHTDPSLTGGVSIPVAGLLGDSHAALFGQHCLQPGMVKATYGTGSSVMMNIGRSYREAPQGLVTSIGFSRGGAVDYVFEGNIHSTGDTIKWLRDGLGMISDPDECETLALSVKSNNGVYLVPAFVGLGAPYWDNSARASITGMGRDANRAHIARAALESIAYQIRDLIDLMEKESGILPSDLKVDGGPTRNNFLMQFQSDILGRRLERGAIEEISALGSFFMAGLAVGFWESAEETGKLRKVENIFEPAMEPTLVEGLYSGWKQAVERTRTINK